MAQAFACEALLDQSCSAAICFLHASARDSESRSLDVLMREERVSWKVS